MGGRRRTLTPPAAVDDLVALAVAARADGRQDDARAAFTQAFEAARSDADVAGMATAATGLTTLQRFGLHAGRAPALLYEAYVAAAELPAVRARLAAVLARTWVYSNDAARGLPFADEAVRIAGSLGDAALLADALDARLATRWGPDDLSERLHISGRLLDAAAHVDDFDVRLRAHTWRLTTALESLDTVGVHRQLAALDVLATETDDPRPRFYALSRRAMHALLKGELDRAADLIEAIRDSAQVPDAYAVQRSLAADLARQRSDVVRLAAEAELFEGFGADQGIASITAEAAVLWLEAGDRERAARIVTQLAGTQGLVTITRDVDWLLTVAKIVEAAAGLGLQDVAADGLALLRPYAGRAVLNAGAVAFHGVVEDYLYRAAVLCGAEGATDWRSAAEVAYRRLGAQWWLRRLLVVRAEPTPDRDRTVVHLYSLPGKAVWSVGRDGDQHLVPDMKGLHYIRALMGRPGVELLALDLSALVAGHATVLDEAALGEHADRQALHAYRHRLRDLDADLAEATAWSDIGRVERLESERDALLQELRGAMGIFGKTRVAGGSAERARVAVRKAIAAALDRLDTVDPATARLLRSSVHTGTACRFEPDPDLVWRLTPDDD